MVIERTQDLQYPTPLDTPEVKTTADNPAIAQKLADLKDGDESAPTD